MVAKIDLRIPGKEQNQTEKPTHRYHVLFVFATLFFCVSVAVCGMSAWELYSLGSDATEIARSTSSISEQQAVMEAEFKRLTARDETTAAKVDFMLQDVPSVEFLSSLIAFIPDSLSVESVKMTSTTVDISGMAKTEDAILNFIDQIVSSRLIESAAIPDIRPVADGGKMFSYSVHCVPSTLLQIIEETQKTQQDTKENAEEENVSDASGDVVQ